MFTPRREPAIYIGVLAAGIVAAVRAGAGENLIGAHVVDFVVRALDPTQGGWLLPVITALVTRFFVYSPARVAELKGEATEGGAVG